MKLVFERRFAGSVERLFDFHADTFEFFRFEPPTRYCERQIRGLFLRYQHEHEFVPDGDATLMRDHIDVELPWWLGGALATRMVVARRLRRFFAYRHRALDALLAQGEGP